MRASSANVQRQLAIFEVVKRARGRTMAEVKAMLNKAFAERGLNRQPGTWLDAVASEAARGKAYVVDLPAAVAADSITAAPDPHVQGILRRRRRLRPGSSTDSGNRPAAGTLSSAEAQDAERGTRMDDTYQVIVIGAGFAGVAAAKELGRKGVRVLLIDANNYHQFQPLLYQVATSQIGVSAVTRPIRSVFRRLGTVRVMTTEVASVDVVNHAVTTVDGDTVRGQILVIAVGAVPNFFNTPGAEDNALPLYSITDATTLGTRLTRLLDRADREPGVPVDVVVVGGGPTGVETAGAMAENIKFVVTKYFSPELAARCRVHLVDMVPSVLNMFSSKSQDYTRQRLTKIGVQLHMGVGVTDVRPDGVTLADGTDIPGRLVVWAGGLKAGSLIAGSGLTQGRGGRIDVRPDLTAPDAEGVYVIGDAANITDATGTKLPQLGSVAQQAGKWAARNIYADLNGGTPRPFEYVDKGYMAMIGRGAAVAELGRKRLQLQGPLAFISWLLVHLALLSGTQQKVRALFSWLNGYVLHSPAQVVVGGTERPSRSRDQKPPGASPQAGNKP